MLQFVVAWLESYEISLMLVVKNFHNLMSAHPHLPLQTAK